LKKGRDIMKKALVLVLTLGMAVFLFACGGGGGNESPPPEEGGDAAAEAEAPVDGGKAYPNANEDGSINLDTIAHYDETYDYTQNPKHKVAYLVTDTGPLYEQAATAYQHWAPLFNCEWAGFVSAGGDTEMYMANLQNLIDQGVTGFILDPDTALFPAVARLMDQYPEVQWMSQMAPPRDGTTDEGMPIGGNMMHPYVGFDNFDAGRQQVYKLIEWKEANLPDVPYEEIGLAAFDFSPSPPLHERVIGAEEAFLEKTGSTDNFFVVDTASFSLNMQGGIDAISPIIATNSKYKYWLIVGLIDDFAQSAASVLDQQGLTDNSCVVSFGGSGLQMQWDAGQQDSFRYALYTAQNLYAEPIIGAVYAYLNGWATPDSIWPSWVNWNDCGADGHTYPQLRLPTVWLTYETYKHYLEWTDMYAKAEAYPYSQDGISADAYSPFVDEIPADYAPK
jgi:ABC-type sugar transport system substrate-binding protein